MNDVFYEGRDLEVLADMPNYYDWIMDGFSPYVRGRVIGVWRRGWDGISATGSACG